MFEQLFGSKKFVAAVAAFLVAAFAELGLDMDTETILTILSPLMAYVVGQGIADHGKEKAKVEVETNLRVEEKVKP